MPWVLAGAIGRPRIALQPFGGADASCGNCWLYSNLLFLVAYAVHLVAKHHCSHGVDQLVSVKLLVGINCHAAFTSSNRLSEATSEGNIYLLIHLLLGKKNIFTGQMNKN